MTEPDFQSLEDIISRFEEDRLFNGEATSRSLGRLAWFLTRSRAQLALTLFELDVDKERIPDVLDAVSVMQNDMFNFVKTGLDPDDEIVPDMHPQERAVDLLVEELVVALKERDGRDATIAPNSDNPGIESMYELSAIYDEDLIHRLMDRKRET